ncbi:MAG: Sec-independent protein translocase protein TatB [Caldilineaceae bacterium]
MDGFFGIGILELVLIAIVALIVLGPERLPGLMREIAGFIRRVRAMTGEFTSQFSEEFKALDELNPRKLLNEMTDPTKPDPAAKPATKAAPGTVAPGTPSSRPPATPPASATAPKPGAAPQPKLSASAKAGATNGTAAPAPAGPAPALPATAAAAATNTAVAAPLLVETPTPPAAAESEPSHSILPPERAALAVSSAPEADDDVPPMPDTDGQEAR